MNIDGDREDLEQVILRRAIKEKNVHLKRGQA